MMMKRVYEFFTKNVVWKLLSLLLAIVLWFMVMNIINPVYPDYFPVTLQIENKEVLDGKYILQNETALSSRMVSFRIKASMTAWNELTRNKGSFKAYIDLNRIDLNNLDVSQIAEGGIKVPVIVQHEFPNNLNAASYPIISVNPSQVDVILDKYSEQEFTITTDKQGDGQPGFVSLTPVVSPETVVVKGAQTNLNTIDKVRVEVDVTSAKEDVIARKKIQILDKNKKDITNLFTLSTDEVQVRVPVNQFVKIPIAAPVLTGNVANGYRFDSVDWSPKYVEVVGSDADIQKVKQIQLPTISIEGKKQSFELTEDLRQHFMDSNVTIKNGTPIEVKMQINIHKESTIDFNVPLGSVVVEGSSKSYALPEGQLILSLKGSEQVLNDLTLEQITASVNIENLDVGVHTVPVLVMLPDGVAEVSPKQKITIEIFEDATAPVEDTPAGTPLSSETPEEELND